jgi:hypothetical protein
MEPEACLMVLRNLMRQAYDKEQEGAVAQEAPASAGGASTQVPPAGTADHARPERKQQPAAAIPAKADGHPVKPQAGDGSRKTLSTSKPSRGSESKPKPARPASRELQQLIALRDAGVLTEEEFQTAKKRLMANA